jgi:hypothetical protein
VRNENVNGSGIPIEGRMAVGGPGVDTPSPSNATDNGGVIKPEVAGFQARKPPPLVKRSSVPKSAGKGWDYYRPAKPVY